MKFFNKKKPKRELFGGGLLKNKLNAGNSTKTSGRHSNYIIFDNLMHKRDLKNYEIRVLFKYFKEIK